MGDDTRGGRRYAMSDAEKCRADGWGVGTLLEGRESWFSQSWGESRIRITAVGESSILAREVARRTSSQPEWVPVNAAESAWTLGCRDWREVAEGEVQ